MRRFFRYLTLALAICFSLSGTDCGLAQAEQLRLPSGETILSVDGRIGVTNLGDRAVFDLEMLQELPQAEIVTQTPWADSPVRFQGPLLMDLMKRIRARGTSLRTIALNGYQVEIPLQDFERYPVILATHKNGKQMSIRERGPIWVIYPWDTYPELRSETFYARSIWQLESIQVK